MSIQSNASPAKSQIKDIADTEIQALAAWAAQVPIPAPIPIWDADLQCRAFSAEYDPEKQVGTIAIEWGNSADMTGAIRKFSEEHHPRRVNVDWQSAYGQRRRDISYIVADDDLDEEGDPFPIIDDEPWRTVDCRGGVVSEIGELIPSNSSGRNAQ